MIDFDRAERSLKVLNRGLTPKERPARLRLALEIISQTYPRSGEFWLAHLGTRAPNWEHELHAAIVQMWPDPVVSDNVLKNHILETQRRGLDVSAETRQRGWPGLSKANAERLQLLLKGHEEVLEEKRTHPEDFLRENELFREEFSRVVQSQILPVLEEIKNIMVEKIESAFIFHRLTATGLKVKLDPWEDYERSLLFFGDEATQTVRITHEGIGFSLLSMKLTVDQIDSTLAEEEAMKFLRRLFGQEQLRHPLPEGGGRTNNPAVSNSSPLSFLVSRNKHPS